MKLQVKNYFSLTKKEWNGMVVLIILIAFVLAAPYIYQLFRKDSTINVNEFNTALAQLNKANPGLARLYKGNNAVHYPNKFNPNNLPDEQWRALGLDDHQIGVIKNYKAKGGRFYKVNDIKKIYGITDSDYRRIAPYINLPVAEREDNKAVIVEINSADSAKLTDIEGIGPAFAKRIVYYRERLGGFISKEQLKEVYGLDEIKYKEIKDQVKVDAGRIHRIAINTISFDKLRLMPYLGYKQVNAIIEYRAQHGNYRSVNDLRNITIIDERILRKIEPYMSYK